MTLADETDKRIGRQKRQGGLGRHKAWRRFQAERAILPPIWPAFEVSALKV
jgi:hypothetical protein